MAMALKDKDYQNLPKNRDSYFLTPIQPNPDKPLFIFLPGMDETGKALLRLQTKGLEVEFDVRCFVIPPYDLKDWDLLSGEVIQLTQAEIAKALPRSVYLCGESFGGCLALQVIMTRPDLFDRLILVNPASSFASVPWLKLGSFLLPWTPQWLYGLSSFTALPFLSQLRRVSFSGLRALLQSVQSAPKKTAERRLVLMRQFEVDAEKLYQFTRPTLLIAGQRDRLLPSVAEIHRLAKIFPQTQTVTLPHSGHACLVESEVNLNQILTETNFLVPSMNEQRHVSVQVQKIRAIGLTVSNVDRSQAFYTKALGFEPVSDITVQGQNHSDLEGVADAKIRIVTLKLGDEQIELMQYLNIAGKPIPQDSQSNDLWFQHFAIVVSNLDRAYAHLQSFPIESISTAPQTIPQDNLASAGVRAFKFKDPDAHNLELIWFPLDKGQAKWHQNTERLFLGIDHSAIAVADTEQSLHFYCDLLGMNVEGSSLNQGETQARLDGLPTAKVRITSLQPAQGGIGIELLDYLIPDNERSMPDDWKSCDLAHVQVELVVNNLEQMVDRLQQNHIHFVSPRLVQFTDSSSPYQQACLVKDPSGHSILLITPEKQQ